MHKTHSGSWKVARPGAGDEKPSSAEERHEDDTGEMDRERAETHLRLLAEAELRRVMTMSTGSIPGRWYSARLALAAGALIAVGAVGADVADQIQADVRLAVAARYRFFAPGSGPGRIRPGRPMAQRNEQATSDDNRWWTRSTICLG